MLICFETSVTLCRYTLPQPVPQRSKREGDFATFSSGSYCVDVASVRCDATHFARHQFEYGLNLQTHILRQNINIVILDFFVTWPSTSVTVMSHTPWADLPR